ncbi:DM13 domain-containing protein [Alkalinema pantanalense CENA528]|uniref:DM13 domain-containing protein n=1 Tax=Alkalinema pantanalense TaxID=1620705 RepID=UPI003D6DF366
MKSRILAILCLAPLLILGCTSQSPPSATSPQASSQASPIDRSTADPTAATPTASTKTAPQATSTKAIKSGSFVSGEHETKGTLNILTQNGQSTLVLDRTFKTSELGPDLVVVLHRSNNVLGSTKPPAYPLKEGDYVVLAPLQKFSGSQQYAIPNSINLADYQSIVIWCRKFNATFGVAQLTPA